MVSVIIPLYNKQEHICRTMDSVLSQSYADFEVIVVDDGSTDKGAEIAGQYKDSRVRVIHQDNAGPGAARNYGTSQSDAPFITYLDADDEWLPGFLQKCVDKLVAYPDCAVAATSFFVGPEKVDRWSKLRRHGVHEGPWRLPLDITQRQLNYSLAVFHACSTVYRRGVVEKYGGFYSKNNCRYGEDVYLWLQIMFNHKIYRISEPLAWYHSEDSQLGLSCKKKVYPIEPCLLDIEPLRKSCPLEYRYLLECWLANHALTAARLQIELRNRDNAEYLLDAFPLIKKWRLEYFKLKIKLMFPEVIPYIRSIKKAIKSSLKPVN